MVMVMVTKRSASGIATTMTFPVVSAQNAAFQKATHTATNAAMTFPSITEVENARGKRKDTNMIHQSRTDWEAQNEKFYITLASDGVGG